MATIPCPLPSCRIVNGSAALFGHPSAIDGSPHLGLDLVAPIGTPIHSPLNGVVSKVTHSNDGGLGLWIVHTDRLTTLYAHLSRVIVKEGDQLSAGRIIGYSGASGMVTGAHLHFGVLVDGHFVDPAPYLGLAAGKPDAGAASAPSDQPGTYPRDKGQSCSPGYHAGTVALPALWPGTWTPGSPWFNRPTNPDGTVDACVRDDLAPGQTDSGAGQLFKLVLPAILEPALNLAVVGGSVVLAWSGVKKVLEG